MRAETHQEVYRPFLGELRARRLRFWPLLAAGLQIARKQRLALLILYAPPFIATVIASMMVYLGFLAKDMIEQVENEATGFDIHQRAAAVAATQGAKLLETVNQIVQFNKLMGMFALLAVAWFASGLICEDRRAGAHQLYFSRPITRLDYFLGKFSIGACFSLLSMLVPALVICAVASVASPEWSFLKQQWDVVPRAVAFSLLWTTLITSLVLAASAVATRRNFALIGVFGFIMLGQVLGAMLGQFVDSRLNALGILVDLDALCNVCFGLTTEHPLVQPREAWIAVLGLIGCCWLVIGTRLRRLEVVA